MAFNSFLEHSCPALQSGRRLHSTAELSVALTSSGQSFPTIVDELSAELITIVDAAMDG